MQKIAGSILNRQPCGQSAATGVQKVRDFVDLLRLYLNEIPHGRHFDILHSAKIHYVKVAQYLNSITIYNFSTSCSTAPVKPTDIDGC